MFFLFISSWSQKNLLKKILKALVDTYEASTKKQSHEASNIGKEAVCVIDNILFFLLMWSVHNLESDMILAFGAEGNKFFLNWICRDSKQIFFAGR